MRAILLYLELLNKTAQPSCSLAEFHSLATADLGEVVALLVCRRKLLDPKYLIGKGKLAELKQLVELNRPEVVMINWAISPIQERNLSQYLNCRILDYTQLILDIFAQRAKSSTGKLQVELAKLEYLSTRLVRGWTHLERQRGGIGVRGGPGETQLEVDRRLLRRRVAQLRQRLAKLKNQRAQNSKKRRGLGLPTIALVGYTNAGKSTLFNQLAKTSGKAVAPVKDMLFTTLDPLLRRIYIDGVGTVVLADTVGFMIGLPHELVEAFHATLEEVAEADLLLHVIDATDVDRKLKITVVNQVLLAIKADQVPQLEVLNKIDLLDESTPRIEYAADGLPRRVWSSAERGIGLTELSQAVFERLTPRLDRN